MFIYTGGYLLISACYRMNIHNQMASFIKEQPSDKSQTQIVFKTQGGKILDVSFVWREENREFTYQGYMYDVISYIKTDSSLIINCFYDKNETELEQNLVQVQKGQHEDNSASKNAFQKLIASVFLAVESNRIQHSFLVVKPYFSYYQVYVQEQLISVIQPPPDKNRI